MGVLGIYGLIEIPRRLAERRRASLGQRRERQIAVGEYPRWVEGEDLFRYPSRLMELEQRLDSSIRASEEQSEHLKAQAAKLTGKDDRSELSTRYNQDAKLLDRRIESMRRVLAVVWRTRSILLLRAHVAVTARRRPQIEGLPEGEIAASRLARAAEAYERAAERVRSFVIELERRMSDLRHSLPSAPRLGEVREEDRTSIAEEEERARRTYVELQNRMDRLADTLGYLADRCRTRLVVEGGPVALEAEAGSEGLIDEVNSSLGALSELAELGDRQLADSAVDKLAEGITHLERAGLEAQAEAEAAIEVERLLQQFPRA
jgi:hypothetical protein